MLMLVLVCGRWRWRLRLVLNLARGAIRMRDGRHRWRDAALWLRRRWRQRRSHHPHHRRVPLVPTWRPGMRWWRIRKVVSALWLGRCGRVRRYGTLRVLWWRLSLGVVHRARGLGRVVARLTSTVPPIVYNAVGAAAVLHDIVVLLLLLVLGRRRDRRVRLVRRDGRLRDWHWHRRT